MAHRLIHSSAATALVGLLLPLSGVGCARLLVASKPPSPPRMTFQLLTDIPLPGPLSGRSATLDGDRVVIPITGGVVVTSWSG